MNTFTNSYPYLCWMSSRMSACGRNKHTFLAFMFSSRNDAIFFRSGVSMYFLARYRMLRMLSISRCGSSVYMNLRVTHVSAHKPATNHVQHQN